MNPLDERTLDAEGRLVPVPFTDTPRPRGVGYLKQLGGAKMDDYFKYLSGPVDNSDNKD